MKKWILAVVLSFAFGSNVNAQVLFSDDFNSGAKPDWGNERGSWFAAGGVYDAALPTNHPLTYSSVTTLPHLTDFILDADVNGVNDGGFWLRSSYTNNKASGVVLLVGGLAGTYNGMYWHIIENDTYGFPIAENPSPYSIQGNNVHVKVSVFGNTYSAYLDNLATPITTFTTDKFAWGSVGLYDHLSQTSFDNFKVTAAPEPVSSTLFLVGGAVLAAKKLRRKISA